jgi:hypothetical protein
VIELSPNVDKHCRIPFGGYAQVYLDSLQGNSGMRSRTVGAISLGSTDNIQGTYKLMSLLAGRLIKAWLFTPLPMPEEVIMQLERMGAFNLAFKFNETDNEYLRTDNEDVRLESSVYSNISQSELADLINNNQIQVKTNENYIPDTVLSQASEIQVEGMNSDFQQSRDLNIVKQDFLSGNEELESEDDKLVDLDKDEELNSSLEGSIIKDNIYENSEEQEDIQMDKIEQEFDTKDDVQSNIMQNDLEKEESMLETINNSSRVQYVTKRGRNVNMRKDLFENYELLQKDLLKRSIDQKVNNILTQWSLKQGHNNLACQ